MCAETEFFVSGWAEFDIKSKKSGIRPNIFKNLFSGYAYDSDCIYINGTGTSEYEFYIQLNRCGTLGGSDHNKKRDAKYKNTEPTVRLQNKDWCIKKYQNLWGKNWNFEQN